MKRIGCFHAHYSNIEYIEQALSAFNVELIHFVDPVLDRIKQDANFTKEVAEKKVVETLDWIANCHVDAILITCTFFTALLNEKVHHYSIPIIKSDEPLFEDICEMKQSLIIVFTNPNTVEGTMNQLLTYSKAKGKEMQIEPFLLENTFELIMQGKKSEYIESVAKGLNSVIENNPDKSVIAAQLSMVPAAQLIEKLNHISIGNHLKSLSSYMKKVLSLEPRDLI